MYGFSALIGYNRYPDIRLFGQSGTTACSHMAENEKRVSGEGKQHKLKIFSMRTVFPSRFCERIKQPENTVSPKEATIRDGNLQATLQETSPNKSLMIRKARQNTAFLSVLACR